MASEGIGKGKFAIEKLNHENYGSWAFSMKMLLMEQGLWSKIECTTAMSEAEAAKDMKAWNYIGLCVEKSQQIHIRDAESGRAAWKALKAMKRRWLGRKRRSRVERIIVMIRLTLLAATTLHDRKLENVSNVERRGTSHDTADRMPNAPRRVQQTVQRAWHWVQN